MTLGPRRRGEVEVVLEPPDHRVADRAADQRQLLAGIGEQGAELVDHRADPVQLLADPALDLDDREGLQCGVGHDRPVYVPARWCRTTDMEWPPVKGQGEAPVRGWFRGGRLVLRRRGPWASVSLATRGQTDMRGLVTAGRCVSAGAGPRV